MNVIAAEYGAGLFALADEENILEEILSQSRALSALFTGEYIHLLINPDIAKSERVSLVGDALDGRVHPYLSSFVKLMTERGIASEIKDSFAEYERLYYEKTGIVRVVAESVYPLDDGRKKKLAEKLEKHIGAKVEIEYRTDPSLIGGMRVTYLNKQIDDSVKSKLDSISAALSGAQI